MKPYYEKDGIVIYHGDSLMLYTGILLDRCCGERVEVLTDPPYGIGYVKGDGGRMVTNRSKGASRNIEPVIGDDAPFDPAPWMDFPGAILWGANHYFWKLPHRQTRWLFWNKLGTKVKTFDSYSDAETAWTSYPGCDRILNLLWKGVLQDDKANNGRRWHPTQKPESLMRWCIDMMTPGATILDPFMGSGTTLVAAKQMGRKAIGIELDERYCQIAAERLSKIE